ncbi:aldo/keto reductase [Psittacicella hinzii]|uniref:Aldo/keto reductase n=1 Tax=Psittacicella hinzii TaxID=2028575 RepID=A0A3A1Y587_9GAMM|nr:aldo/keto reductase [Psittacicella hinzii]RIY31194.1 aldo/keto reductase [Psittacicella hinzii]
MTTKQQARIALGTWSWGQGFAGGDTVFGNNLSIEQMTEVFNLAMENGLNLWDTAAVYGMGSSEEALGTVSKNTPREELVLSTKFTPNVRDYDSKTPVTDMLNASFARLNTDYFDYYWIHNPTDVNQFTEELASLVKAGKIKKLGVSNHNLEQIKLVNSTLAQFGLKLDAVQNHYSLLYRYSDLSGIRAYCEENGIEFFAYMVLEQGALSGRYNVNNPLPEGSLRAQTYNKILPELENLTNYMAQVGKNHGDASVAQVAVAWALAKGTTPLIGATKPRQVLEAAQAQHIVLTAEEVAQLETLAEATGVNTRGSWENIMVNDN